MEEISSNNKDYQTHVYYLKFALQFADYQVDELVNSFNHEVNNKGWVGVPIMTVLLSTSLYVVALMYHVYIMVTQLGSITTSDTTFSRTNSK